MLDASCLRPKTTLAREITNYWVYEKLRREAETGETYDALVTHKHAHTYTRACTPTHALSHTRTHTQVLDRGATDHELKLLLTDVGVQLPIQILTQSERERIKIGQQIRVKVASCDPREGTVALQVV